MSGKYVGNTRIAARADLDAWYAIAADAIPALQAQTADIYAQLGTIQGAVPQRSLDAINIDLTNLETAIANLQSAVALIESEIATLQAELATIEAEIATIMAEIATLFSDIAAINATLASLQAQINAIVAEMLVNPMTTHGDMIVGGASPAGGLTRLAVDTIGKFLVLWGSPAVPTWLYLNLGAIAAASGQPIPTPVKRVPTVYGSHGTYTFTVPATCYSIEVELWGPGGPGSPLDDNRAQPGGGGGYLWLQMAVTPGDTHAIVVGAPGANTTFDATVGVAQTGDTGGAGNGGGYSGSAANSFGVTGTPGSTNTYGGSGATTSYFQMFGGDGARGGRGAISFSFRDSNANTAAQGGVAAAQPGGGAAPSEFNDFSAADGQCIVWAYE